MKWICAAFLAAFAGVSYASSCVPEALEHEQERMKVESEIGTKDMATLEQAVIDAAVSDGVTIQQVISNRKRTRRLVKVRQMLTDWFRSRDAGIQYFERHGQLRTRVIQMVREGLIASTVSRMRIPGESAVEAYALIKFYRAQIASTTGWKRWLNRRRLRKAHMELGRHWYEFKKFIIQVQRFSNENKNVNDPNFNVALFQQRQENVMEILTNLVDKIKVSAISQRPELMASVLKELTPERLIKDNMVIEAFEKQYVDSQGFKLNWAEHAFQRKILAHEIWYTSLDTLKMSMLAIPMANEGNWFRLVTRIFERAKRLEEKEAIEAGDSNQPPGQTPADMAAAVEASGQTIFGAGISAAGKAINMQTYRWLFGKLREIGNAHVVTTHYRFMNRTFRDYEVIPSEQAYFGVYMKIFRNMSSPTPERARRLMISIMRRPLGRNEEGSLRRFRDLNERLVEMAEQTGDPRFIKMVKSAKTEADRMPVLPPNPEQLITTQELVANVVGHGLQVGVIFGGLMMKEKLTTLFGDDEGDDGMNLAGSPGEGLTYADGLAMIENFNYAIGMTVELAHNGDEQAKSDLAELGISPSIDADSHPISPLQLFSEMGLEPGSPLGRRFGI